MESSRVCEHKFQTNIPHTGTQIFELPTKSSKEAQNYRKQTGHKHNCLLLAPRNSTPTLTVFVLHN